MFDLVLQQSLSDYYSFFILALLARTALSSECNISRAVLVDGMCVLYDSARTNWFTAHETCAKYGMHLVTVQSAEQMERMVKAVPSNITLDAWTGGNDHEVEGMFVWEENHRPIVEKVWRSSEPNHDSGDEDCTFINSARRLNDVMCNGSKFALCMFRIPPPAYYFGENVTYLCHCMEGPCDESGYCRNSSGQCATGWFGPGCQLRSLSGDRYGPLGVLADNDVTTCSTGVRHPVTIQMKAGSFFTWIRIIVEKSEHLGGFEIYFNVNQLKVLCQGMKELSSGDRSLDIVCHDGPYVVDDVILNWSGEKNICSVYVNGEQNFALLQSASVSGETNDNISLPVDGRRSPTDACFEGLPRMGKQDWELTFKRPKIINEIIIHRKPKVAKYASMNGFYVQGFNEENKLLFRYNDTGQNADKSTVWIITEVKMAMKKFVISMDQATHDHHLELCEVEAFGACAPPDYGLYCEMTCDMKCLGGECHHNGECVACGYGIDMNGNCLESRVNMPITTPTALVQMNVSAPATSAAPTCPVPSTQSPPAVDDNSWLIRLLILSIVLLSVLVVLLILYILKNKKEQAALPPPDEAKAPGDDAEAKGVTATKSSHSHHSIATEKENTAVRDESAISIKSGRTESTRIT